MVLVRTCEPSSKLPVLLRKRCPQAGPLPRPTSSRSPWPPRGHDDGLDRWWPWCPRLQVRTLPYSLDIMPERHATWNHWAFCKPNAHDFDTFFELGIWRLLRLSQARAHLKPHLGFTRVWLFQGIQTVHMTHTSSSISQMSLEDLMLEPNHINLCPLLICHIVHWHPWG